MTLYLDGCSMIHGQGLPRDQCLATLFRTLGGYQVTDQSSPGKSNMSMAFDVYHHRDDYDIYVLGWTYSSRFGLKYQDQDLKFYAGHDAAGFGLDPQSLDHAHQSMQKYFFSVFGPPYSDQLSDMLIDTTIDMLTKRQRKIVCLSWEHRNTDTHIHYPFVGPDRRLPDGHLNQQGVLELYHYIQNLLDG